MRAVAGAKADMRARARDRVAPGASAAARALALALAALGAAACGASPDTISRDEFVASYVALRVAELEEAGNVIPDEVRDSVLAARGVTEEDLDAFVEAHGRDVVFMQGVWTEVDSLMSERAGGPEPEP